MTSASFTARSRLKRASSLSASRPSPDLIRGLSRPPPPFSRPHPTLPRKRGEGRVGAVAGTSPATLVYDLEQTKSAPISVKYVGGKDLSAVVAAVRRRAATGWNQQRPRAGRAAPTC